MKIEEIHTLWPEKQGFVLCQDATEDYYIFVHFLSTVVLKDGEVIKPGAFIIYKPFSYRYFNAFSEPLLHDWMHIKGDVDRLTQKYNIELNRFYYTGNDKTITNIMQELEIESLTQSPYYEKLCSLKIEELLLKISRSSHQQIPTDFDTYKSFLKLRSYIQTNYYEINNVDNLSSELGFSPSRFYVLYKKIFGISPKQDLINIRIEHAKQLLSQKQYTITQIAQNVGYSNPYHFIRQFKSKTGFSPLQFSKKI